MRNFEPKDLDSKKEEQQLTAEELGKRTLDTIVETATSTYTYYGSGVITKQQAKSYQLRR